MELAGKKQISRKWSFEEEKHINLVRTCKGGLSIDAICDVRWRVRIS